MSCIVTPKPPAPQAPCMRALAPSYDSTFVRSVVPFSSLRNMQNVPILFHCTGNVPHKCIPVHTPIPIPILYSLTKNE